MRFIRLVLAGLVVAVTLAACGGGAKLESTRTLQPTTSSAPSAEAPIARPSGTAPAPSAIPATTELESLTAVAVVTIAAQLTPASAYLSPQVNLSVTCPPSTTVAQGSHQFMTMEQFGLRYHCVVNQFPWPAAYVLDVDRLMSEWEQSGTGDVQAGLEFVGLAVANECAWYNAWLDARKSGDAAAEQRSLWAVVNITPNIPNLIPGFPPDSGLGSGPGTVSGIMRSAALLGDTGKIQTFVEQQGCRTMPWKTGS